MDGAGEKQYIRGSVSEEDREEEEEGVGSEINLTTPLR